MTSYCFSRISKLVHSMVKRHIFLLPALLSKISKRKTLIIINFYHRNQKCSIVKSKHLRRKKMRHKQYRNWNQKQHQRDTSLANYLYRVFTISLFFLFIHSCGRARETNNNKSFVFFTKFWRKKRKKFLNSQKSCES